MNFIQRRKILKNINSLDLVPVALVSSEETPEGTIKLVVPKFKNQGLSNFILSQKRTKTFNVNLDQTGSLVWDSIDGEKSVGYISKELKAMFVEQDKSFGDCEQRVVGFITKLYQEGFITFRQIQ